MSGGSKTVNKTKLDPQMQALYMGNYNNASGLPLPTPYTGDFTAPLNATEKQAGGLLSGYALNQPGSSTIGSGIAGAKGVLGYSPSSVTADSLAKTDLTPYMNPFTKNVIQSSLATLDQQRGQQQVADNQAATNAHAFGGTRQAVRDALTSGQYDLNEGNLISGLNADNFSQARSAAAQDIANRIGVGEFNTNAGLTANGQRLSAAGLLGDLGNTQFNNAENAANSALNYGYLGQQTQNANDLAKYQDYLRVALGPYTKQGTVNQSLGIIPYQGTQTQSTSTGLGGILGGVLGLGATAGMLGWKPFGG